MPTLVGIVTHSACPFLCFLFTVHVSLLSSFLLQVFQRNSEEPLTCDVVIKVLEKMDLNEEAVTVRNSFCE